MTALPLAPRSKTYQPLATMGNLAFAFTPSEIDAREAYRFVLYHVMHDAPMQDIFRIETFPVGDATSH